MKNKTLFTIGQVCLTCLDFSSHSEGVATEESHWFFKGILRLFAPAVNGYGRRLSPSARAPQDDIKSIQPFTFSPFQLSSLFTLHASLYRSPKCLSIFFPKTNLSSFHPFTLSTLFTLHPSHLTLIRTYRLAVLSPFKT